MLLGCVKLGDDVYFDIYKGIVINVLIYLVGFRLNG